MRSNAKHLAFLPTAILLTLVAFCPACQKQDGPQQGVQKRKAETAAQFPKLLKQLESEKADDRITALYALGGHLCENKNGKDLATAVPKIAAAIGDRKSDVVRSSARTVLTQIGEPASEHLTSQLESLDDVQYAIGAEAIKAIGPAAGKKWFPLLKKNLASYTNDDTKLKRLLWTLEALTGIGKEASPLVDEVFGLIDHKNMKIQVLVLKIVTNNGEVSKKHGPRIAKLIEKGTPSVRSWALQALGAIGKHDDYDALQLLTGKLDAFLLIEKQRALEGLALMGEDATPSLEKIESLISDNSKSAMCSAAYAHWKITGDKTKAISKLKKLLDSRSFADESIQTLGRMGQSASSLVPILKLHLDSPEPVRRENALFALGDIGAAAKPTIERLEKLATDDKDAGIRGLARIQIQKITAANGDADSEHRDGQKSSSEENSSPPRS